MSTREVCRASKSYGFALQERMVWRGDGAEPCWCGGFTGAGAREIGSRSRTNWTCSTPLCQRPAFAAERVWNGAGTFGALRAALGSC